MALPTHASKRSIKSLNESLNKTPMKNKGSKIPKMSDSPMARGEKEEHKAINLEDIHSLIVTMNQKLNKLDTIEAQICEMKKELNEVKHSVDYAHEEINDLKTESERKVKIQKETSDRIDKLEAENIKLHNAVIDLQARSMRDNLIFYNIQEREHENTTKIIHDLLEEKIGMVNAKETVKIDRSHRLGKRRNEPSKPRPIIVKFNYHQDREFVRLNAKKLKGTNFGISEQFPTEIEQTRRTLYPELKKAKAAGKKVNMVRDKLFIDGVLYKPTV
ncbi:Hypothetical predicted protein [Paramuricea clavata]|uniref:Uncharacterized protein n=1 Tax=Paramuricea clavata TaxID=317549 RepID=A0A7D9DE65_PARCT|nr:Hypothetical predicted protein [Paramuricea clavata]